MRCLLTLVALGSLLPTAAMAQNPRDKKVRDDKVKVEADGYWIYNNLPKAFDEAKKTGKPIVVILRCIPCEECVKLDDDLVNQDPTLRPLLEKYIRVRVVSTNGLDLSLFQYDYDQSFACFLLNADGTIYGRFGTRSHRTNWLGDVSIEGLAKALQGGLDLHAGYPKNKDSLAAKRGPAPEFPVPEKFPALSAKYTAKLNYEGNVVQSCIHCHQIGDAIRTFHRAKREPMPQELLFPYPHPKSQGLILDPKDKATVKEVLPGTPAAKSGLKSGDRIETFDGQPMLSIADVQWVLHRSSADGAKIEAQVLRDGKPIDLTFTLEKGWRQTDDIAWRSSSWGLRAMATGGILFEEISEEERQKAGAPAEGMALRAKHVGQYGAHAAGKKAGFLNGDIVISWDGKTDLLRDTDVLAYGVLKRKPGDTIAVKVLRGDKSLEMKLPMQE